MTLTIADSVVYNISLALIAVCTVTVTSLICATALKERRLRQGERPIWSYWLLGHQLQRLLALSNLIEIVLLSISFPLVQRNRSQLCHDRLTATDCARLGQTWGSVLVVLGPFALFFALTLLQRYFHHRVCLRDEYYRSYEVLHNRPGLLFLAHILLQAAAVAVLSAVYSSLFFDRSNVHAALVASIATGAVALAFFSIACLTTIAGIARYHMAMKELTSTAASRFQMQAACFGWLRPILSAAGMQQERGGTDE
ncbi:MAG: hypothetical protein Q9203_003860 [Teloschistes exilis]